MNKISTKKIILLLIVFIIITILFETFQQIFYINTFNLPYANKITFNSLVKHQLLRWLIWLLYALLLWLFIKKNSLRQFNIDQLLKISLLILLLTCLAIISIAILQFFINEEKSINSLFTKYIPFYTFQKGLIFIISYISFSVGSYLHFTTKKLSIQLQRFSELKSTNNKLFEKLNTEIKEQESILNIKIGNKRKIIPIETISWIESDDYCVKIHTNNEVAYSMRSSLKDLEEKLKENDFLRVHRKAIINCKQVNEFDLKNNTLRLLNTAEIKVSKTYIKVVKNRF